MVVELSYVEVCDTLGVSVFGGPGATPGRAGTSQLGPPQCLESSTSRARFWLKVVMLASATPIDPPSLDDVPCQPALRTIQQMERRVRTIEELHAERNIADSLLPLSV